MSAPVMTAVQRDRLLKTCDHLEGLAEERFDFSRWVGANWMGAQDLSCGAPACALGWGIALFGRECGVELQRKGSPYNGQVWAEPGLTDGDCSSGYGPEDVAEILYGVVQPDFDWLFVPSEDTKDTDYEDRDHRSPSYASAKQVAAHIRVWLANRDSASS